jgi:hypothetical protein
MARIATEAACSPMLVSATGTSSRTCGQGSGSASQAQHLTWQHRLLLEARHQDRRRMPADSTQLHWSLHGAAELGLHAGGVSTGRHGSSRWLYSAGGKSQCASVTSSLSLYKAENDMRKNQCDTHLGCDGAGHDVRVAVPADCQLSHLRTMQDSAIRLPFPMLVRLQLCSRSRQLCLLLAVAVRVLRAEMAAVQQQTCAHVLRGEGDRPPLGQVQRQARHLLPTSGRRHRLSMRGFSVDTSQQPHAGAVILMLCYWYEHAHFLTMGSM